ncbi:hypothetical protein TraAM80_01638 [Trypanosoma rangeli]|uniref:Uncharacterized protein n=1 Tax=Trypanosoma rangeli TaxID=5698 RepID=A0A3R7NR20_TRYRA|nr:uncharacterized protein TraAM80_01638 [Trypanosoma rangeli]RNF10295.1 hypothetical protein TraAM80_01638 [Trypanosoma rangeli]|eukprot:RNF10295.1 hypothetical protein TraAM80_01638 [Trypanosoma rangeli]
MPLPPPRTSVTTTHDATSLKGKNTTAGTTTTAAVGVVQDGGRLSVFSSTSPRPVEAPAREEEENARRKGRAIQRKILRPLKSAMPEVKTEKVPRPLPLPPRTSETMTPGAASKTASVTSASRNSVQSVPLPQPQALPPSIFDDAPVQASLEYLTRPHRSWDSAVKIRERRGRRQERGTARRAWRSSSSLSNSLASSASVLCASSNRMVSHSSLSVHSAPPMLSHPHASVSPGNTPGGGTLRRGRFGVPLNLQPSPEGLAVDGSSLSLSFASSTMSHLKPLPQDQAFFPTTRSNTLGNASAQGRGANTPALGRVREFTFTMQ